MMRRTLIVIGVEMVVIAALLILALDQYTHARTDSMLGVNHRGYRGPVANPHASREARIVMVGGTSAFEADLPYDTTVLRRLALLTESWLTLDRGRVTAFNLALPNAPHGSYGPRLEQFRSLAPDVVVIYVDLAPAGTGQAPGAMMRMAGYVPALPPLAAVDRMLGSIMPLPANHSDDIVAVADAVAVAITMARGTVVAVPRPTSDRERMEHDRLMPALEKYSSDPRVTIVAIEDGPPVRHMGMLMRPPALQLELPVRSFITPGEPIPQR